jgi:hypothetical protein
LCNMAVVQYGCDACALPFLWDKCHLLIHKHKSLITSHCICVNLILYSAVSHGTITFKSEVHDICVKWVFKVLKWWEGPQTILRSNV